MAISEGWLVDSPVSWKDVAGSSDGYRVRYLPGSWPGRTEENLDDFRAIGLVTFGVAYSCCHLILRLVTYEVNAASLNKPTLDRPGKYSVQFLHRSYLLLYSHFQ